MLRARPWLRGLPGLVLGAVPALALAAAPCPEPTGEPSADERTARELFDEALRLEPGQPEAALAALECVDALAPKPAVALRMGTIAERLGEPARAADAFERYLERAGDAAPDAAAIRERIAALRAAGADPPPGEHPRAPAPPPSDREAGDGSTQALWGWVVAGSGLAIGIVGIGLLAAARATSSEVHDLAPGTTSWDSDDARGRFETAQTEQSIGIVAVVAGATLGALGLVVVGTAPSDPAMGVTAFVRPGGAGLGLVTAF